MITVNMIILIYRSVSCTFYETGCAPTLFSLTHFNLECAKNIHHPGTAWNDATSNSKQCGIAIDWHCVSRVEEPSQVRQPQALQRAVIGLQLQHQTSLDAMSCIRKDNYQPAPNTNRSVLASCSLSVIYSIQYVMHMTPSQMAGIVPMHNSDFWGR